jgi:hypothetical protein
MLACSEEHRDYYCTSYEQDLENWRKEPSQEFSGRSLVMTRQSGTHCSSSYDPLPDGSLYIQFKSRIPFEEAPSKRTNEGIPSVFR